MISNSLKYCFQKVSLVKLKNYILYYINNSYVKLKNFQQAYHYVKGLPQGICLQVFLVHAVLILLKICLSNF